MRGELKWISTPSTHRAKTPSWQVICFSIFRFQPAMKWWSPLRSSDGENFGIEKLASWSSRMDLLTVRIYAKLGHFIAKFLLCFTPNFYGPFFLLDGKYHVLPSGDLHIFRAEEMEAEVAYSCRVLNTLTNVEESSPPFHLAVDSMLLPITQLLSSSALFQYMSGHWWLCIPFSCRHWLTGQTTRAYAPRPLLLFWERWDWCFGMQCSKQPSPGFQVIMETCRAPIPDGSISMDTTNLS